jgi:hypothetical protein
MNAPLAISLLDEAIARVRHFIEAPDVKPAIRLRILWAAAKSGSRFGAVDVVEAAFLKLAREAGLVAVLGKHGEGDARHVIRWALEGRNPFGQAVSA